MPLWFLKFPFLVQNEISKHFDDTDLFFLSTLSTKCAGTIRKIGLKANKLRYYFLQDDILDVKSIGGCNDEERERFVSLRCFPASIEAQAWDPTVKLRIENENLEFICERKELNYGKHYYELQYPKVLQTTVINVLQKHIMSIFRRRPHLQLYLFTYLENPKIEHVKEIIFIDHNDRNTENLSRYLKEYPDIEGARITHMLPTSPDERMFSINKLICQKSFTGSVAILKNFKGTCLWLKGAIIPMNILAEFIKNWRKGDKTYRNLKAVDIFFSISCFVDDVSVRQNFMEGIERSSKWDPKRRPQNYSLNEKLIDSCLQFNVSDENSIFQNKLIDCEQYYDVMQTSTGKLASFRITKFQFTFLVWDICLEIESIVEGLRFLKI